MATEHPGRSRRPRPDVRRSDHLGRSRTRDAQSAKNTTAALALNVPAVRHVHLLALAVAFLVTVAVLTVHVNQLLRTGALWRDEVNCVQVATMPTLSELWRFLEFESFPVLWLFILRGWTAVGLGGSDLALRTLGLLVGLAVIGALWFNARQLGYSIPLFSLLLLALNSTVIRWGDTIRGYGLGLLLIVLTFGAIWRVNELPTRRRIVGAVILAILSVQAVYTNAFFLLAICIEAGVVNLLHRRWKGIVMLMAIGMAAAVSLLPYKFIFGRAQSWAALVQHHVTLPLIIETFSIALTAQHAAMPYIWLTPAGAAVGVTVLRHTRSLRDEQSRTLADLALYATVSAISALVIFFTFLVVQLKFITQPWYYLSLLGLCASSLDVVLGPFLKNLAGRLVQVGLAVLISLLSLGPAWQDSYVRLTNIDAIAQTLERTAASGDLIVVWPFFVGITFNYYYHGQADWTMLPGIEDRRVHRYDVIKQMMHSQDSGRPVLEKATAALRSGHKVWFVRPWGLDLHYGPPVYPAPPPRPATGWNWDFYNAAWRTQMDNVLRSKALDIRQYPVEVVGPVGGSEASTVLVANGWRGD